MGDTAVRAPEPEAARGKAAAADLAPKHAGPPALHSQAIPVHGAGAPGVMGGAHDTSRHALRPQDVMRLQMMAGNRAVDGLLEPFRPAPGKPPARLPDAEPTSASNLAVQTLGQPVVQRNLSDADRGWAEDSRTKIRGVMDDAGSTSERLNSDAEVALAALKSAQATYDDFEQRYNEAVGRFTSQVKKALEAAQELRDNVKFAASTALSFSPLAKIIDLGGKISGELEKIDKTAKLFGVAAPAGKPPEVKVGPSTDVDWKGLLGSSVETFETYLKQNKGLTAIAKEAKTQDRWLSDVIEGKVPAEGVRTSAAGVKASKAAEGATAAKTELAGIAAGLLSAGPLALAADVAGRLGPVTGHKLEQDIALKWIGGLSADQIDAINDAESYLRDLGVIDSPGSRTGAGTSSVWTTKWDEKIIWIRAKMESAAMQVVGRPAEWLGGQRYGDVGVSGTIRADDGSKWGAFGPPALSEQGGGFVGVNKYQIAPLGEETSNWGHQPESEVWELLRSKVSFSVTPIGATGGGATPDMPHVAPG